MDAKTPVPSSNSRRRPGRPAAAAQPAAPDEELLAQAIAAFAELGYEGASIRELARRLGVSHNLVHWRFGSKEKLWRAAVEYGVGRGGRQMAAVFDEPCPDDTARLRALVVRFAEWAAANPDVIGLINIEGRRESWRLDFLQTYITPFHRRLDELLERLARDGAARAISGAAFMVLLVHGVGGYFALGPLMRRLAPDGDVSPQAVRRQAEQFADVLVGSIQRL